MKDKLRALIEEIGFDCIGEVAASELKTRPEVRDMCAADKCHAYNHSWACPPACGSIESYQEKFGEYETCIVFQTVAQMEDEFDFETMMEAQDTHKQRFFDLVDAVSEIDGLNPLLLCAGTCTICKTCTYPDEPCRFPAKRFTSMEAAGLVVGEVCTLADIPYNHGKNTLAYSSCALV